MSARCVPAALALLTGVCLPASAQSTFTRKAWPTTAQPPARTPKTSSSPTADPGFTPIPQRSPEEIVGGGNAAAYPWMTALVGKQESDLYQGQFCGGSLIHPQWVLTAAHCVEGLEASDLDVAVGGTDLNSPATFQRIPVAEIIPHPKYNALNSDSDIALLRLAWAASGGHSATILLADTPALETPGTNAKILGWGTTTSNGSSYPTMLQEGTVPLVSFDTANASYGGTLTGNMIAAGGTGAVDSCYGDSGGPLAVFDNTPQRWLLTGIVSFGDSCATVGSYGIYSRVSPMREFILRHLAPGYLAWETPLTTKGRARDPDGDNQTNWNEFIAASDPLIPGPPPFPAFAFAEISAQAHPTVTFNAPTYRPELDILTEFAPDSLDQAWQTLDPALHLLSNVANPDGTSTLTYRSPAPHNLAAGFFRVSAKDPGNYRFSPRSFSLQSAVTGSLTSADPQHPSLANTRQHLYTYTPGPEAGSLVKVFLRSNAFDARLELLDSNGAMLQTATSNAAKGLTGKDESITFTPAAATTYQLRVTSAASNQSGRYTLGGYRVATFSAITAAPTNSTNGSLTGTSPLDPLYEPGGGFRSKDYRIDALDTSGWRQFTMSSTAVDAIITLLDAETGFATAWSDDDSNRGTNGTDARLRFRAVAGHDYILRCSTTGPGETGSFNVRLTTPTMPSVAIGSPYSGTLNNLDDRDYLGDDSSGYPLYAYKDSILLTGLTPGAQVTVTMTSPVDPNNYFDTYLQLRHPLTGMVISENDDISASDFNSRITFTARFAEYVLTATSSYPEDFGNYSVSVTSP